ncbi:MAG: hypothetical protein A2Z34_02495 [Planctomycetes bacterium RBG_16_59_8]|nr:MAG: hypothetical protein A2Z34_02495 [Planctomycetes bacterium RBG_16_59_8]
MNSPERNGHEWVREHLEAYTIGGLGGAERARVEEHVAACASCRDALEEIRQADQSLTGLFAGTQPSPGFEDRVIQKVREARQPLAILAPFRSKALYAVAATLLFGTIGFMVSEADRAKMREAKQNEPPTQSTWAYPTPAEQADRASATLLAGGEKRPERMLADSTEESVMVKSKSSDKPASPAVSLARGQRESGEGGGVYGGRVIDGFAKGKNEGRAKGEGEFSYRNDAPMPASSAGKADGKEADASIAYFNPQAGALKAEEKTLEKAQRGRAPVVTGNLKASEVNQDPKATKQPPESVAQDPQRKIIRNGEAEFEVDRFDDALAKITQITREENGFIATTNSEKLPNGKVRGIIVVRVPPDRLDTLMLKFRALGDLKSQQISSQDVTKHYTDTQSRLRAARAMEERLLNMIKSGKGEIKDLLEAEKELGNWRVKIEEFEGEIKYYDNLTSLSTLTLTIYERDIKTPSSAIEREYVNMGIESDDVEKHYAAARKAIEVDCKGRITRAELKKYDAGQLQALINCEVPPEKSGELIDRFTQFGKVVRKDQSVRQETEGGTGRPEGIKVERKEAQFSVSLYNIVNVAPKETVHIRLAADDVEELFRRIVKSVNEKGGRVITSNLNGQKKEQTTGTIRFEVRKEEKDVLLQEIKAGGEVMYQQAVESPDTNAVTDAKRGFSVTIVALASVPTQETVSFRLAAVDVPDAFRKALEAIRKSGGRIMESQLNEQDRLNLYGNIAYEISREKEKEVADAVRELGDLFENTVSRAPESQGTVNSKVRFNAVIVNIDRIDPREATTMGIEVNDVDKAYGDLQAFVLACGGKVVESHVSRERDGRTVGKLTADLPYSGRVAALEKLTGTGIVRVSSTSGNPKVPEGKLARARFEVTIGSIDRLLPGDKGIGESLRGGFKTSLDWLLWSLNWIVIGLCFAGPWALILWICWRIVRRSKAKATTSNQ